VQSTKNFLADQIKKVFAKANYKDEPELRLTNIPNFDLQLNNLLRIKNSLIKKEIFDGLKKIENHEWIENVELVNNGFVNIKYSDKYLIDYMESVTKDIQELVLCSEPKNYLLDYGGVNIGKSMHVGHIRTLNIGRGLKNLLKFAGNNVTSDIHLGDWGMPVALILNYCYLNKIEVSNITIQDLERIYPEASILSKEDKNFLKSAQELNLKLNNKDLQIYKDWEYLYKISTKEIKKTLSIFEHAFDIFEGESNANDYIEPLLESLKSKNLIEGDDGALIAKFENKNVLITKSDGSYLYITTDLGTVMRREESHDVDVYAYIVDQRQKQHFEDLFNCIKKFQLSDSDFIHIGYGTINDVEGKPLKTRDGGSYQLTSLYKDVEKRFKVTIKNINDLRALTNSVITYSDLQTNRLTDYKFDIEKFTETEGNTAVYLQYTLARSSKLLEE
jgi:arginyl-tRNA synthetase